jgi:hypothetical protein
MRVETVVGPSGSAGGKTAFHSPPIYPPPPAKSPFAWCRSQKPPSTRHRPHRSATLSCSRGGSRSTCQREADPAGARTAEEGAPGPGSPSVPPRAGRRIPARPLPISTTQITVSISLKGDHSRRPEGEPAPPRGPAVVGVSIFAFLKAPSAGRGTKLYRRFYRYCAGPRCGVAGTRWTHALHPCAAMLSVLPALLCPIPVSAAAACLP